MNRQNFMRVHSLNDTSSRPLISVTAELLILSDLADLTWVVRTTGSALGAQGGPFFFIEVGVTPNIFRFFGGSHGTCRKQTFLSVFGGSQE